MSTATVDRQVQQFRDNFRVVREEVSRVIVGNDDNIVGIMTCLLARGHVLLEGIPGIGKTKLVQTLADVLHLKFARIQFTPDLMPGDIIGTTIVREDDAGRKHLVFQRGPIFANLVLADEINRATPKTQSALLEAMQENSVSAGGQTHPLEQPFFVLATMNPLEMEGTYPLPEAQLDRFFFKLRLGFPTADGLHEIIDRTTKQQEPHVDRVLGQGEVLEMRETARSVPVARHVQQYAIDLTLATHPESEARYRDGQALRALRLQPARHPGADPRRQGQRAAQRSPARRLRRHPHGRAECAAPPAAAQLRRRGRGRELGRDPEGCAAAGGGAAS